MGEVAHLVGSQRAAAAGVLGPAVHAGFEEGAIDDELTAALEHIEQAHFAVGPVEYIRLLHGYPRHPPTLGGKRVTGAGQCLLLHEELLAGSLPLLGRHDRRCSYCEMVFHISLLLVLAAKRGHTSAWVIPILNAFIVSSLLLLSCLTSRDDQFSLVMTQTYRRMSGDGSDKCGAIRVADRPPTRPLRTLIGSHAGR